MPLGAFLSGGVDSSAVVAIMAGLSSTPVKTFSIGFDEARYNELPHARRIAERYGCEHHEFEVRPNAVDVLPTLVRHYGEPYADSSAIPSYYLSQLTRRHVTVALNGDGGDEAFARLSLAPRGTAGGTMAACAGRDAFGRRSGSPRAHAGDRRSALNGSALLAVPLRSEPVACRALSGLVVGVHAGASRGTLWRPLPRVRRSTGCSPIFARHPDLDGVDAMLAADVDWYLPTDLLVKIDIATMANSLEGRSPFLDHPLAEFVARLPSRFKVKGWTSKYILKKAVADLVPAENLHRAKQGFAVPIGAWFRGELKEMLADHLLAPRFAQRGLFESARGPTAVRRPSAGQRRLRASSVGAADARALVPLLHRQHTGDRSHDRGHGVI